MHTRYPGRQDADPAPPAQSLSFPFPPTVAWNRLVKSALTERNASDVTKYDIHPEPHLEAVGNPVISLTNEPVESDGRFEAWRLVSAAGKAGSSLFLGQVTRSGRQVTIDIKKNPVLASDVQLVKGLADIRFNKRHTATAECHQLNNSVMYSSVHLEKACFVRTDAYGASLQNRALFVTDIADDIRMQMGSEFVMSVKTNSVESQESGFTIETAGLCQLLKQHKFNFFELGGASHEAVFLEFAEKIAPTFVTGGVRSVSAMFDIGQARLEGVGIGRPACIGPRLPRDIFNIRFRTCIKSWFDEQNFGLRTALAGTQTRQMGRNEESADNLLKDPKLAESNGRLYGFVKAKGAPVGHETRAVRHTQVAYDFVVKGSTWVATSVRTQHQGMMYVGCVLLLSMGNPRSAGKVHPDKGLPAEESDP
ncbi:uncharacterized protein LY79DRAFT_652111 [Colletotrichum navitas]|uniref:Uncharacterized protein n=1 Tax=Colletotrichum navitas TaxID=681940 RepID=A0AAD8PRR7_9PEZI|nr:uncharacterized protein LY79DRAFT_652111 [Colletotrichum navitas]KAK1579446.1 hypothetical protein LY79DRAFT_652111 [Colletotrichum navitas]